MKSKKKNVYFPNHYSNHIRETASGYSLIITTSPYRNFKPITPQCQFLYSQFLYTSSHELTSSGQSQFTEITIIVCTVFKKKKKDFRDDDNRSLLFLYTMCK